MTGLLTCGRFLLPLPQGMRRTIQCLQDQLQLISMEAQEDFSHLSTASRSLQQPTQDLQEKISRSVSSSSSSTVTLPVCCVVLTLGFSYSACSSVEHQASAQVDLLTSTSSALADSLRLSSSRSVQTLEELTGRCSDLHGSVSGREPPPTVTLGRASPAAGLC